ncbi:MAG: hypothetical protein WA324_16180 [Bryobacteraceae bacterium]
MNYSETVSKRVLETVFPGATMDYRPNQSHCEYDFDLRYSNGATVAVEVTAAMDETLMKTVGAIYGKRAGGPVIRPSTCRKSWLIFPINGASIRRIRADADIYLAALEREGIDSFSCLSSRSPSVENACCHLQITGGAVISSDGNPTIHIAGPGGVGAVGPSDATEAGEFEAWKQDNRTKLGATKMAERHLVVYIDESKGLPWIALTSSTPPAILPKMPEEITNLWLIGQGENKNQFVVWHGGMKEIWQRARVQCAPEIPKINGPGSID